MERSAYELIMFNEVPSDYGEPICILEFGKQENGDVIKYDKYAFKDILLHEDVKNRKIIVITIVGGFRKGKSFLLDYFLRYLYANYTSVATKNVGPMRTKQDWIGSQDEPLIGFSWRGGNTRDTTGLVIWSDVFLHTTEDGEKIAILLIDTQGLFDRETDKIGTTAIASLSTLISSLQIYNLTQNIQSNDLEYLLFFSGYAQCVSKGDMKPFQNLQFLIRDWQNPVNFPYGSEGGAAFLNEDVFNPNKQLVPELKQLHESLLGCFENIDCCLMPYPGKSVATSQDFDGRLSNIDEDFVTVLMDFIPKILCPEGLKPKKVNGIEVTAAELFGFFEAYVELYLKPDALPEIIDLFETTVKMHFETLITHCVKKYLELDDLIGSIDSFEEFEKMHTKINSEVLLIFDEKPKMENDKAKIFHYKTILTTKLKKEHSRILRVVKKNIEIKQEMIRNHFESLITDCVTEYVVTMSNDPDIATLTRSEVFQKKHSRTLAEILMIFDGTPKMINGPDEIFEYRKMLEANLQTEYCKFSQIVKYNFWKKKAKQALIATKVTVTVAAIFYPALRVLKLFGL